MSNQPPGLQELRQAKLLKLESIIENGYSHLEDILTLLSKATDEFRAEKVPTTEELSWFTDWFGRMTVGLLTSRPPELIEDAIAGPRLAYKFAVVHLLHAHVFESLPKSQRGHMGQLTLVDCMLLWAGVEGGRYLQQKWGDAITRLRRFRSFRFGREHFLSAWHATCAFAERILEEAWTIVDPANHFEEGCSLLVFPKQRWIACGQKLARHFAQKKKDRTIDTYSVLMVGLEQEIEILKQRQAKAELEGNAAKSSNRQGTPVSEAVKIASKMGHDLTAAQINKLATKKHPPFESWPVKNKKHRREVDPASFFHYLGTLGEGKGEELNKEEEQRIDIRIAEAREKKARERPAD